jgi:hypothetical protein
VSGLSQAGDCDVSAKGVLVCVFNNESMFLLQHPGIDYLFLAGSAIMSFPQQNQLRSNKCNL